MINTYRNLNKMSDMFNMMDIFNNSSSNNSSSNNDEIHNDKNNNDGNNNDGNNNYKNNSSINTSDMLGNIMNSNQKDLYNEYIKQLDSLDFNVSQNESR